LAGGELAQVSAMAVKKIADNVGNQWNIQATTLVLMTLQ
jgi:hypothetical protein